MVQPKKASIKAQLHVECNLANLLQNKPWPSSDFSLMEGSMIAKWVRFKSFIQESFVPPAGRSTTNINRIAILTTVSRLCISSNSLHLHSKL